MVTSNELALVLSEHLLSVVQSALVRSLIDLFTKMLIYVCLNVSVSMRVSECVCVCMRE